MQNWHGNSKYKIFTTNIIQLLRVCKMKYCTMTASSRLVITRITGEEIMSYFDTIRTA
jgi:hypothetical protein